MPKSKRRPAAVAKKKKAAETPNDRVHRLRQNPAVARRQEQIREDEIGTESIGTITAVKRYADDRPAQIELD